MERNTALRGGQMSPEAVAQEKHHFQKVLNAFAYYRTYLIQKVERLRRDYLSLPHPHRHMLPHFSEHLDKVVAAVDRNNRFALMIISCAAGMFTNSEVSQVNPYSITDTPAPDFDMEKVKTTIKQFYRDWSKEGSHERDMCYKPIIDDVLHYYPPDQLDVSSISILVPGAGLGRLAYELASRGYRCQGNEFSLYMLFGSNFILNSVPEPFSYTICPWVNQFSNHLSYESQTAEVMVPDVSPTSLPQYGLFSMTAGDFMDIYVTAEEWDCVVCCYFIDTAHNIIQYLERIFFILKPGGLWINFGPLLYHYTDMPGELSLELCWEDIQRIAEKEIGFEILKEERGIPSHYIQNPHSMMEMTYKCVYLVARKPKNTHPPLTRTSAGVKGDESDGVRCASVKGDQSDGVRCEGVIGREDNSTKQPETA